MMQLVMYGLRLHPAYVADPFDSAFCGTSRSLVFTPDTAARIYSDGDNPFKVKWDLNSAPFPLLFSS